MFEYSDDLRISDPKTAVFFSVFTFEYLVVGRAVQCAQIRLLEDMDESGAQGRGMRHVPVRVSMQISTFLQCPPSESHDPLINLQ